MVETRKNQPITRSEAEAIFAVAETSLDPGQHKMAADAAARVAGRRLSKKAVIKIFYATIDLLKDETSLHADPFEEAKARIIAERYSSYGLTTKAVMKYSAWLREWGRRSKGLDREHFHTEISNQFLNSDGGFQFGSYLVADNICLLHYFVKDDSALSIRDVQTELSDEQRPLPDVVADLKDTYLPSYIERCKQLGQKYHDDPCYSLDRIRVNRYSSPQGRRLVLELGFSPTTYSCFAMSNLALDQPLVKRGVGRISLRQALDLGPSQFDASRLTNTPLHLRFGTNTVVETSDGLLALPARSPSQAISPGAAHRLLVAPIGEGMLRPTGLDPKGRERPP